MGSYDGVEVCDLVGLFIFHQLSQLVGIKNIGLYRDDGLAILENASGPTSECIKKKIKLFYQHSLKITTKTNLVQTNFLNVTFNLKSGKYWPYHKPNDQPLYVHLHSNHPPTIKKPFPLMLADCLSLLSYNRKEFARAIPEYEEAMQRSGHPSELQYIKPPSTKHQMTLPKIIMVVVKSNLKLATTTIIRALNVSKNIMPLSYLKPFGMLKTQEKTHHQMEHHDPHHTVPFGS